MKKAAIILVLLAIFFSPCARGESEDGGYAGAFLKIPMQARPTAMGGAYLAVSDDPAGQSFNPSGIQSIIKPSFSASYRAMHLDRQMGYLTFIVPTKLESALGVSWQYVGYGSVEGRNRSGSLTGNTISASENVFSISFAKRFESFLALGTKLNYYLMKIEDLDANSVGINLGASIFIDSLFRYGTFERLPISEIRLGAVVSNIAATYPWDTDEEGLQATQEDAFPLSFGFGASAMALNKKLLIAADIEKNVEQDILLRIGGEYNYDEMLFIRAGLNNGTLTAGAGFLFNIETMDISIDYAFSNDKVEEGEDHIFSLNLSF